MANKVCVPVLWNQDNSFQNNALICVASTSRYVATVMKPAKPYPPAIPPPNLIPVLQIETPDQGTLYVNLTEVQWQQAVYSATGIITVEPGMLAYEFTNPPNREIQTITAPQLYNATINMVVVGGNIQTLNYVYLSNPITKTGTIDFSPESISSINPLLVQIFYTPL